MTKSKESESNIKSVEHLLGYFDFQVLAAYRNEPHKFVIESDFFEGELSVTGEYYQELENTGRDEYINVRFGYRTLEDGNLVHLGVISLPVFDRRPQTADGGQWSAVSGPDCCPIYAAEY